MSKILYFDCFSGISGDMTIGALLDLGIDPEFLQDRLNSLNLEGYQLEICRKQVKGISGTDFDVRLTEHHHHHHDHSHHHHEHRNFNDIETIIEKADLDSETRELSRSIFLSVAKAEAKVHGKSIEEVHFHEVGAIDSIIDIVGAAVCLNALKPDKIYASPLHLGSGTIKCAHGILPVPAPATVEILEDTPVYSSGVVGELVTPTGAAIIKTIADEFGSMPTMTVKKSGYGCGKKDFGIPNLLRVVMGEADTRTDLVKEDLVMLETNIDDMNPEIYSHLIPRLLEQGALDAFLSNIIMKKGRPGILLNVLCKPHHVDFIAETLFHETTTLGIRKLPMERLSLERKTVSLETSWGTLEIKAAYKNGEILKAAPEYEDCKRLSAEHNLPVKKIYEQIMAEIEKSLFS